MSKPKPLDPVYAQSIQRLRTALSANLSLDFVPEWIVRNTTDPANPNKRWSFHEHEYQIEIVRSTVEDVCVQKCSQVGLTELTLRLALAVLSIWQNRTLIYTMPTVKAGRDLMTTRVNPIIESSPALKALLNRDVDSSELKRFGGSFMYIKGTMGQRAAISVPAKALFQDEIDFSDEEVLKTYVSRLGHNKDGSSLIRRFSTPTVAGYGINEIFLRSSQGYYTVWCRNCQDFTAPRFLDDVEVPGLDGSVREQFDKSDLGDSTVKIDEAFCRCPVCKHPLHWDDFLQPSQRKWLHFHPMRKVQGWQVQPWDVPAINTIPRTLRQIADYRTKKDWVNFKVGDVYEDADVAVRHSALTQFTSGRGVAAPDGSTDEEVVKVCEETILGVDVGHISHLLIGKLTPEGYTVIYAERIRQNGENYLTKRVLFLCKCFGVVQGVVDHKPDFTFAKMFVQGNTEGKHWACHYTGNSGKTVESLRPKLEDRVVIAHRTARFDSLVRKINSGEIRQCQLPDTDIIHSHLKAIKRVERDTESEGGVDPVWVSVGEDHYAHALNYLDMAYDLAMDARRSVEGADAGAIVLPSVSKVRIGSLNPKVQEEQRRATFISTPVALRFP